MVRILESEDCDEEELLLQIIINLSSEPKLQSIFIQLNAIYRITTLLFKKISSEMKNKEKNKNKIDDPYDLTALLQSAEKEDSFKQKNDLEIKYIEEKYVISSENLLNKTNFATIPFYFMILSNLTLTEEGQKKFLNLENEKIKGIVFMKILEQFFDYIYHEEFDFCSSLLANISSVKEGRRMILELKIFKIFLIHFDKLNNFKMLNILRIFRNCCFEFEEFQTELLVNDSKLFNLLIKVLILTNVSTKKEMGEIGSQNVDEIYFTHFNQEKAQMEKEIINDIIIDCFLILTNSPEGVEEMKNKGLGKVFDKLYSRLEESQNLKDRVFVISNYLNN
jgi:predicted nucleic acid-binding Zn finger protein